MQRRAFIENMCALSALAVAPARALYDPKPAAPLASMIGAWRGTLVYADYQKPDNRVTLPTVVTATLGAPNELVLYYVFDDGPGKTVYSYERMTFDFTKKELLWVSGTSKPNRTQYALTLMESKDGIERIHFERAVENGTDAFQLEIKPRAWSLVKREVRNGKEDLLRSRYEFAA
jgi:hypothetical protein